LSWRRGGGVRAGQIRLVGGGGKEGIGWIKDNNCNFAIFLETTTYISIH